MKLLMLCREPRLYSCQRLKQAAEMQGYQLDILDPNRFLLTLSKGKFELFYQAGESFDKARPAPFKIENYLGVLPRFGITSTEIGCHLLRHFELQGIPVLNSASAFKLARDKWQSLQQLASHHIPIPDTQLTGESYALSESLKTNRFPLIAKTLSGSQGVGVMLFEAQSHALSVLDTLRQARIPTLTQQFIAESKGRDIRAFVIGNQVVAAMQRIGRGDEFRANIHQGGEAQPIELSSDEKQLAIQAAQAIGLEVAGVDLVFSPNGLCVIEVNASPGLEMIEKTTGVDIAQQMIAALLAKLA